MSKPPPYPSLLTATFRPKLAAAMNATRDAWFNGELEKIHATHGIRQARDEVQRIERELSPEHRLHLTESLARWQAHLESFEDDGVPALMKGDE